MVSEPGTETVRRHVVVSGRVQGVLFRHTCAQQARAVGVTGWVENRVDGRVEAVFEGSREAVERVVAWCHHGPPRAVVTAVDIRDEPPRGERQFATR
jgi:acylphosphatase